MASILFKSSSSSSSIYYQLCLISFITTTMLVIVNCTEFEVGGHHGWAVPNSKDTHQIYNQWSSQNRFKVGDTLRFKYEKDSVLVVSEEEYAKCRSSHPLFFSNKGDTLFYLERPGMFYFISGVSGHCTRGQKMTIKVLAPHNQSLGLAPQSHNANLTNNKPHSSKAAAAAAPVSHIIITTTTIFSPFVLLSLFF